MGIIDKLDDAFVITGNNDGPAIRQALSKSKFSSHLKSRKILNQTIYGISDGEIEQPIKSNDISGSILLTHRPPDKAQLRLPLENAPKYHISGHLHSQFGTFKYTSTTHIQIPSLMNRKFGLSMYGLFDPQTEKVEFKKINQTG